VLRVSSFSKSKPLRGASIWKNRAALPFGKDSRAEAKGAGVNDMPGACQNRDPARSQAGESATLHHDNSQICLPGRFGYFHVFWANIPVFLDISTKSYSHPTKQIGWERFLYRNSSSYLGTFWCKAALHNARLK
jgi:hypothetical protein